MEERPGSLVRATQLIGLLLVLALLFTALAVVFDDELVATWAGEAQRSADDTRVPPSFTPVVVVLYAVVAILTLILTAFVRGGHNWARHTLAALIVLTAVGAVGGLRVGPPLVFVVGALVTLLVDLGILAALYHRDTSRFLAPLPRETTDV